MKEQDNFFCVIMAGGIGSRFWPLSRQNFPKQFLDILGTGRTLIQDTFDRFLQICPKENIFVVTNHAYVSLLKEQLPTLADNNIISEHSRRNTAPCIAYANQRIKKVNPNATIIVAPSDHLILKEKEFNNTILQALRHATEKDHLITLGIKPSRPDTGYGYIQFENGGSSSGNIRRVISFTEKPDYEKAQKFLEGGDFYWNSGIFIWNLNTITSAFNKYLPEMNRLFTDAEPFYLDPLEEEKLAEVYNACENVSIDYGIMEKANNVDVMLADFGWSDLGTWGSLYTHLEKDNNENASVSGQIQYFNSKGNIVNVKDQQKMVVLQGLDDFIVVDTEDVLMICKKEDEQSIKQIVEDLKQKKKVDFI